MKFQFEIGLFGLSMFLTSCEPAFTCDKWASGFRDNDEFNMVLTNKEQGNGSASYLYGEDLDDGQTTDYQDDSGWIEDNFNKFKIGDTLIKEKGKYTIFIKRKGKIDSIPFECNGKIYRDK